MKPVDISVCIVTYKARELLRKCLQTLIKNTESSLEIIVVDNGSGDGTAEMIQKEYPSIQYIRNSVNQGYTKPMNQALRKSRGGYVLQLNPDTEVLPGAIDTLANFLNDNPVVGICGPKVLNRDGSFQAQCRRGESRPWAVISYFSGLSTLFPESEFFGQYLLNYFDEDSTHPVAGVSGSCMLVRKEVFEQIGYLDERFFAFQEDSDFCLRTCRAGWEVYYVPDARIIHYGSLGGSHVHQARSIYEWHKSYFLFYRKNYAGDYFFLFNWLYYAAMFIKFVLSLLGNYLRKGFHVGAQRV
jgi:GT2 family glycosyltransferase